MADYEYLDATGVIVPNTSNILVEVQDEYKAAFGSDLIVTPDTPQGVLITAETLARSNVVTNNAAVANQINPNIAGGVFLDAIMSLTGVQRNPATKTLVYNVVLAGVAGTVIPKGTQAQTVAGDLFQTQANSIIGVGGSVTVTMESVEYGPIPCPSGELTTVITSILGWETITNPDAGILGSATQSDVGARAYRQNTLGFQGVALPITITSALYATTGVQSLWFQENVSDSTETINGISMVAHSIYVCVNGGSDLDVASALLENKSSGCAWNGGTSVDVVEPVSGQTYTVTFDRPTEVPILVKVTTSNGDTANIKSAILAYANGEISGEAGFVVGADISPWELAGAITTLYPTTYIKKVEVSYADIVSYTTDPLTIDVNQIATITSGDISVVIS